ncbi:hypothetical protein I0D00_02665 [Pseudomonas lalucatii]|uniref:DUF2214 domain-containing protein n=1 Tax=Pseudomonas lalucatii TaxID=1424203 RepID=A0ABS5PXD0_9PSED|nr:hypothetical protein [Pseudomonas lalucatii]MBS7660853.1 hypothetical protein [Pseudomonas lalucatii]MBS7691469.1 hypothetical protein [Pseudomonas lalucatii]
MLKTLLIYSHLLATCVALGTLLQADHKLWRWRKEGLDEGRRAQLAEVQQVVGLALLALWGTGLALVAQGYLSVGPDYLLNQKLWAKGSVVVLLSINGLLLHRLGFPLLHQGAFVALPVSARLRLGLLGALSMSAWLFAAFLGVARPWNEGMTYLQVMGIFAALWLLASLLACLVVTAAGARREEAAAESC